MWTSGGGKSNAKRKEKENILNIYSMGYPSLVQLSESVLPSEYRRERATISFLVKIRRRRGSILHHVGTLYALSAPYVTRCFPTYGGHVPR